MPHVFEPAPSARAKCRGCGRPIARGELRFGERIQNPFAEGETTLWFHPSCAAYKRPEPLLAALAENATVVPDSAALEQKARATLAHRRLPRIDGAERAPSSQARCRHCKEPIARGTWRIALVFHEDGRFSPGGYVHLACRHAYFEQELAPEHVLCFSHELAPEECAELVAALASAP